MKSFFEWFKQPFDDLEQIIQERNITNNEELEEPKIVVADLKDSKYLFRPKEWSEYVGQDNAKEILKAWIDGTKARSRVFPHTIIYGPAGCGKTTLAKIISSKLNVSFKEILSRNIKNVQEIFDVIKSINGGVLFLDEVHALNREMVEPLYPIMEDFIYKNSYQLKPFTIIGATTEAGEIVDKIKPFFQRFKLPIELSDYSDTEIKKIIKQYVGKTFPSDFIEDKVYKVISENAKRTPRVAITLIESAIYLNGNIDMVLNSYNIIYKGFTKKDYNYLRYLERNARGVGLNNIASFMNTSKQNVISEIEPYLIRNEIITTASRGRTLTEKGKILLQTLKQKQGE